MCGIAGIVGAPTERRKCAIKRMVGALRHRGPDGDGIVEFEDCVLGHTRLLIIDLEGGAQPLIHDRPNGNLAVTFNGEIYGYKKVREQFGSFPFTTQTDTLDLFCPTRMF